MASAVASCRKVTSPTYAIARVLLGQFDRTSGGGLARRHLRADVDDADVVLLALFHAFRLAGAIGEEGQVLRIRCPGDRGLAAALARGDAMGITAVGVGHFEHALAVGLHRPGEVLRIRR